MYTPVLILSVFIVVQLVATTLVFREIDKKFNHIHDLFAAMNKYHGTEFRKTNIIRIIKKDE